jgi:DNA polymerase elongation subunit (family B)
MAYQNIFFDRKTSTVHLWDDRNGYANFKYQPYAYRKKPDGKYVSIYGDKLEKVTGFHPAATGLFESDVPVETKVLVDAYADSDEVSSGHRIAVIDIEVNSVGGYPNMQTFNQPITAVAVYNSENSHYYCYVLDEKGEIEDRDEPNLTVRSFKTEEALVLAFLDLWEKISPTIATGWNIDGFDFPYLHGRIEKIFDEKTAGRLSPIGIAYFNKYKNKMTIAGINCLDYLLLYKRYSQKQLPNFRLDTVAKEELKQGKVSYEGSLDDLKKNDPKKFIEYNVRDIQIIVQLNDFLKFIDLAMSICHVCHVGYEEFHVSSKFLEGAMLTYLRNNKLVAPNKIFLESEEGEEGEEEEEKFEGAYVKDPIPGRYEWVCSADINSLYPSAIMTLNISPETKLGKIEGWDTDKYVRKEISEIDFLGEKYPIGEFEKLIKDNNLAVSANGVIYDQNKVGCIPEILKVWFAQRVEFKNKMKECSDKGDKEGTIFWKRRQQVQKILLNSLYGVVGMKGWRFYDKDNAEAITLTGQSIIKTSEKFVNGQINKRCGTTDVDYIIAMDTDSLYINFAPLVSVDKPENPKMFCVKEIGLVAETLNKLYSVMVVRMYNSSLNRIVIAADVVTSAALWTSKKHYAMLKVYDMELKKDIDKLEVKGLDMVRSSYPKKFREFMGEVLMDLLKSTTKKELDAKILAFKAKMKDFELQDIAKNTGVAFVSKNENKVNYDPKGRDPFNFISKTTAQAKAALAYNDMLKKYKLSDTEPIMDGGKIKWVYLHDNPLGLDGLAFKDDGRDPKLIMDFLNKYVDRERIWESELQTKLEDFYSAVKWDIFSVDGAKIDEFFTF